LEHLNPVVALVRDVDPVAAIHMGASGPGGTNRSGNGRDDADVKTGGIGRGLDKVKTLAQQDRVKPVVDTKFT